MPRGQSAQRAPASRKPQTRRSPTRLGAPNQYHLAGDGISVSYFPTGAGPVTVDGPICLFYQDASQQRGFRAGEIRVVDDLALGRMLSVELVKTIDVGDTTFTLLLPSVQLPEGLDASAPIETIAITTIHRAFIAQLGHAQVESYTTALLTGSAARGILPLTAQPSGS
jgi:hypothetical protein